MHLEQLTTDAAVLTELGQRLAAHRLARNLTQPQLAEAAGVGRATVQRIERGESVQTISMVRVLRSLDLLGALDAAVPETVVSPLAELTRARRSHRSRARVTDRNDAAPAAAEPWTWGDEETPSS
jgi:transcriptional regulator with XRE-family HTH domain